MAPKKVPRKSGSPWQLFQLASQFLGSRMSALFSPMLFLSPHLELGGGATGCGNCLPLATLYVALHFCFNMLMSAGPSSLFSCGPGCNVPRPPFSIFCSIFFHSSSQIPYSDPAHAGCRMAHLTSSYLSFRTYCYKPAFPSSLLGPLRK